MTNTLANAPAEVHAVCAAMEENARQAWPKEDIDTLRPVYAREETAYSKQTWGYEPTGNWLIGCSFEGFCSTMVWKPTGWFYRESWSGRDVPMKGGHEEALANARVCFTG
jgi:hypothetical protein